MLKKDLANYVKTRNAHLSTQKYGKLTVVFKDNFVNDIDHEKVFLRVNNLLPEHFLELIDIIYVGDFNFMREREINASFKDGAIYLSNIEQDDESDLIDDIIHEFAHAVERKYGYQIYLDGKIEDNFLAKRRKLRSLLKYDNYDVSKVDFTDLEFSPEMDNLIKNKIGYRKLEPYIKNLFLGGYSVTSVNEYFARGFEEFYLGNVVYLKTVCPYIYNKLFFLNQGEENIYEV